MSAIQPDQVIDGRYRVISRLGSGGMADVYLVEDEQLGRKVALKLLHGRFSEDPGFVERFRREAQAAASLQHPNVVGVFDRGAFNDTYYIAMEYLPGRSLKQLILQEAPLEPVRAIDIALQILKATRFAHRRGVIHRDLKPHNVIVDESDNAKVTDFGIARAGASDMTETGSIMGTAQYLSPEQAQGHAVSETSDLYSVGVVLYEMLTGRVPFDAESAVTIALKHVSEAPTPPSTINPSIPPALEQVVLWALNKNPADRPTDADQFIAVLEQVRESITAGGAGQVTASMAAVVAAGMPAAAIVPTALMPAAGVYPPPPELVVGDTQPPVYREDRRDPGGSPWPWIALVIVLLLLAGGGVAAYLLTRPAKATVPTVVGLPLNVASARVENANFTPSVLYETSPEPANQVIAQDPLSGERKDQGSTVTLTVSQGPGNVNVPSVNDLSKAQAEKTLKRAGLTVSRVLPESSDVVPMNYATRTDPGSGASVSSGSGVTLYISSGRAAVNVPNVTGETQQAATSTLTGDGFKVTTSNQSSSTQPAGTVLSQSPSSGTAAYGSAVGLVIATAPTTSMVPSVVGDTAQGASSQLTGAGFKVKKTVKAVNQQSEAGIVISQTPGSGATATKGSTVTILIGKYKASSSPTTTPNLQPTTTTTTTTT